MIWLLVFTALILAAMEALSMRFDPARLGVRMSVSKALAEPDEPFDLIVTLTNRSRVFLPFLRVSFHMPEGMNAVDRGKQHRMRLIAGSDLSVTAWMRPRQQLTLRFPVSAEKRGIYRVMQAEIESGDFLGLTERRESFSVYTETVIAPRKIETDALSRLPGSFPGDMSVRRYLYEDPMFTVGFGEYTGREPMRAISWNASARAARMMVKQYDHTVEMSVSVVLNIAGAGHDALPPIEACFRLCRSVCEQLEEKRVRYRVYANADPIGRRNGNTLAEEGLGQRHLETLLENLGRAAEIPSCDGEALLAKTLRRGETCAGIVLVTPVRDELLIARAQRIADEHGTQLAVYIPRMEEAA